MYAVDITTTVRQHKAGSGKPAACHACWNLKRTPVRAILLCFAESRTGGRDPDSDPRVSLALVDVDRMMGIDNRPGVRLEDLHGAVVPFLQSVA